MAVGWFGWLDGEKRRADWAGLALIGWCGRVVVMIRKAASALEWGHTTATTTSRGPSSRHKTERGWDTTQPAQSQGGRGL